MGVCSLAGVPFRIDPESVNWSFTAKVSETKTLGGKVVQVYGASLDDMQVEGWFGSGGFEEQKTFLARMKKIAEAQESRPGDTASGPVRFLYPGRGWDFLVYLKAYTQPGGSRSITLQNELLHNLRWALTLHIAEENIGLKAAGQDLFIKRLSEGLGWNYQYHGRANLDEVLQGKTVTQYATDVLVAAQTATPTG
jgi:hypothetical protein